jgi:hypothetical protein
MRSFLIVLVLIALSGCTQHWKPLAGATVGGGIGSIGGPAGAAVGGGFGYTLGELSRTDDPHLEQLEEAKETIKALSEGDVDKLVEIKLNEAKNNGFFDGIVDGIYSVLKICAIGLAAWLAFQFWLSHKFAKKEINKNNKKDGT